jgi:LPS sulfotransferase NodH
MQQLTGLTSVFGKDLGQEERLASLNELLLPIEVELEREHCAPARPVVLVLGPPRGGTTLTSQLISRTGLFGTVSNFAARFWLAPALGLRIERDLGLPANAPMDSFESRRGITPGWSEPNEFGYFWSRFFDLGQDTHCLTETGRASFDRAGLRRAVAAMEAVCQRPMAFKNNTWFTFHPDLLEEVFPGSVFVVCRRDPLFVAQSLWLQRQDLYGDVARWWSVRPPNYHDIVQRSPIEQVAAQAVAITAEMDATLARGKGAIRIDANYSRLVTEPRQVVAEIATAVGISGPEAEIAVSRLPERLESTDRLRLDVSLSGLLRRAVESELLRFGVAPVFP